MQRGGERRRGRGGCACAAPAGVRAVAGRVPPATRVHESVRSHALSEHSRYVTEETYGVFNFQSAVINSNNIVKSHFNFNFVTPLSSIYSVVAHCKYSKMVLKLRDNIGNYQ